MAPLSSSTPLPSLAVTTSPVSPFKRWVLWLTLTAFVGQPLAAAAQVVAAGSTPGTRVGAAQNGVPVVQIATPNGAGVSHNQYQQFNVDQRGVVLNNSRTLTQTQQAGWIEGNANLNNGMARIILNEVTSNLPSSLKGYTEVAGQKAEVVIANPNGITCDGCGFINTSRGVLTTGTPVFGGSGSLDAFRVTGGNIAVQGNGLNGSNLDQLDLIARSVQVNANLWAQNLNVITGPNRVDYASLGVQLIPGQTGQPTVGIDVAALGGMYANKIRLVGTEAGVGVNVAGTLAAQAGDFSLTNAGKVTLSGTVIGNGQATVSAGEDLVHSGTLYGQQGVSLSSGGTLQNTGLVASQADVAVTAQSVDASGVFAAGMDTQGAVTGKGGLQVTAVDTLRAVGRNLAGGSLSFQGGALNLAGAQTQAGGDITWIATQGDIDHRQATTQGQGKLSLSAVAGQVKNDGGVLYAATDLTGNSLGLSNQGGQVVALNDLHWEAGSGSVTNQGGVIQANRNVTLSAGSVDNANTQGNGQGIQAGNKLSVTADQISNRQGNLQAGLETDLFSHGTLDNSQGKLSAGTTLSILDGQGVPSLTINNDNGTVVVGKSGSTGASLTVQAATLAGNGQILSWGDGSLNLSGDYLQSGKVQANGNLSLTVGGLLTNSGTIQAGQRLAVKAATLDNQGTGEISGNQVHVTATDTHTLTNRGLIDGGEVALDAVTLNNLGTGRIYGDHLSIGATTLTNSAENGSAPVIAARNRLDLGVTTLNNQEHATLLSAGDLVIGGALDSNRQATGQAGQINNASATIEALGNAVIGASQLNNTNQHFSTQTVVLSQTHITEYQLPGHSTRWLPGQAYVKQDNHESTHTLYTPEGSSSEGKFYEYNYTRTVSEDRVMTSDPGKILAGGGIQLTATSVLNDKSQIIAGGTLGGTIGALTNTAVDGQHVVRDSGDSTYFWYRHRGGGKKRAQGSKSSGYNPAPTITGVDLTPTLYEANTASAATSVQVSPISANPVLQASATDGSQVRTTTPNTWVPNSSLYTVNPSSNAHSYVETDPRFANYRTWVTSDYMLTRLGVNPDTAVKRLGDGFYEQKLVADQVRQLSGKSLLAGYSNTEQEYQALMASGVSYGDTWHLTPGVALTAEQMAQLTNDMVWLVEKTVTLADGSQVKALVPEVYLKAKDFTVTGNGALIAGNDVQLNVAGSLNNSGTIAASNTAILTADTLNNLKGRITGQNVLATAQLDINNLGGRIDAAKQLAVSAGRDLNVVSTTQNSQSSQGSRTNIDRVATLAVTGDGGSLTAVAGRTANFNGASVSNGTGTTTLVAGQDLNFGTVTERNQQSIVWNDKNYHKESQTAEVGTTLSTGGDIQLSAGRDVSARGAQVQSNQGKLTVVAARDISVSAANRSDSVDDFHQQKSKGFLSSKTETSRDQLNETLVAGSLLSANQVSLQSGRDLHVTGSNVVSSQGTTLLAGNDLTVDAATETRTEQHYYKKTSSGIFSSGASVTLGTQKLTTDSRDTATTAVGSTIGSVSGDVVMQAGGAYTQTGSGIQTPGGNVAIQGKTVTIQEARNTNDYRQDTKFEQSGLTLAVSNPVLGALQTASQLSHASDKTSDPRMKALALAGTALAARDAEKAVMAGQGVTVTGEDGTVKNDQIVTQQDGKGGVSSRDANAADKVGGIGISVSVGSSQSKSTTTQHSDTASASTIVAGGNISVKAVGGGKDSNVTVQGSALKAGGDIDLEAENAIRLLAAQNTNSTRSSSSSSSGSLGVGYNTSSGFSIQASANSSKGKSNGDDLTWTNTEIQAGQKLTLKSGGDTTLQGAVAQGGQVVAQVGGNLNIVSLQDTSTYDSHFNSNGFSISVPLGAGGLSGSVSASTRNVNSDYRSVTEQSGLKAGDSGFQVAVTGDTTLQGGAILSTQKAVEDGANQFSTGGTLSTQDLKNKADYQGDASGFNIGAGVNQKGTWTPAGSMAGVGSESGSASSTTQAAISGIAGNKNARTGDKETGIGKIFDAKKVEDSLDAQVQITQIFGQLAPKVIAEYAEVQASKYKTLAQNAELLGKSDEAEGYRSEAAKWGEGGLYRGMLHTAIGGLAGGVSGAVGAGTAAAAAPLLSNLQDRVATGLENQGISSEVAQALGQLMATGTATALGAIASKSDAGGAMAFDIDANNRQLHIQEENALKASAKKIVADRYAGKTLDSDQRKALEQYWYDQLEAEALAKVDKKGNEIRNQQLAGLVAAEASGDRVGINKYLSDAQYARNIVSGLSGAEILGKDGNPIVADGNILRAFESSRSQYEDPNLFRVQNSQVLQKEFGSLAAAKNASAQETAQKNFFELAGLKLRTDSLIQAYKTPSEGVEAVAPELYLIGSGRLLKIIYKGVNDSLYKVAVYRVFGGDARAEGFSWTTENPLVVQNYRDVAGLPSGGASGANNTANFLIEGRVKAVDVIKSRPALPLDGNRGGLPELIINPKNVKIIDFSVLKR
ncbi:hemagglutinin repeat-containing protein [Azospira inquinata]|uniref:Hemagglutinin repeat-containing protein n=1 Tax=Azospira inquinata TaxID=2785627 RepID=A0A975SPX1_9RHOO|nr:hemagglutinin repeat-containing protein [Azospira inquinata]QWT47339.1 hemagglutinin repeat-containing protein [Azospira inquinata]QWT50036.1 hemagglutinin repeat-containing protein [Azospira inquinata]